ncbi:MAG TPA: lysophospholipid acyltransferase family protein [Syntrophobacteraceae bacterium]|nr:lysophospholipid acyltransferase family protein [Syntrophobacteraceae bacterium]
MKKLLRSFLFFGSLLVSTIVLGSVAVGVSHLPRGSDRAHRCGRLWARINLWAAGVRVRIRGLDRIDPDRSYIYAANHQGWFDIFALFARLPVQFRFLAKKELFRIPILGRAMSACGYIPIDRADRRKAFQSIDEAALRVRNGTSILIFPEGTRSPDGVMKDFKAGGFVLAVKSQQPIVPVSISGSSRILPKGSTWLIQPGPIHISVGSPIPTEGSTNKDKDILMSAVRDAILRGLTREEGGVMTKEDLARWDGGVRTA